MVYVPAWKLWDSRRLRPGLLLGCLGIMLILCAPSSSSAQPAGKKAASTPPAAGDTNKAKSADDADDDKGPANAPDVAAGPVADPSQTSRIAAMEVFKDPKVAGILDLNKLSPILGGPAVTRDDLVLIQDMANNPNVKVERSLIDRFVRGNAAKLTDRQSIRAILEDPDDADAKKDGEPAKKKDGEPDKKRTAAEAAKRKAEAETRRIVSDATANLLDPIFRARAVNNAGFLTEYRRSLQQFLPPLLKNHLIPRVQAMIVLGEAASPEYLTIFQSEIANKNQALWVKLWALQGITNIKLNGGRPSSADEAKAAKLISEFLDSDTEKSLPWPIQFRAIQALGALRQGFLPTAPQKAHMAQTAMAYLVDNNARMEVRAEAAHTLGLMQITAAVPKYNFTLVAHGVAELAAQLGEQINALYVEKTGKADNPTKARYLTALLVGPVYQAFEGDAGQSGSGLRNAQVGSDKSAKEIRQVLELVKPVAQSCVELLYAPPREYKDRKKALTSRIAALRTFMKENPPPNRRLVDAGRVFGGPGDDQAGVRGDAPAQPLASVRRGR